MKNTKFKHSFILILFLNMLFMACSEEELSVQEEQSEVDLQIELFKSDQQPGKVSENAAFVFDPAGETITVGQYSRVTWGILTCGCDWTANTVNIDLYKGSTLIRRIGTNVNFWDFEYDWRVPSDHIVQGGGDNFKIKMTDTSNAQLYAFSGEFTIIPINGIYYTDSGYYGGSPAIRWYPYYFLGVDNVTIQFRVNGVLKPAKVTPNDGAYYYSGQDGDITVTITGGGKTDSASFDFIED
ncbi:MAG: hypothetical protein AAFX87_19600 [Bacteroidota bacterium]